MAVLLSSTPRWPTPLTVTATTAAWAGTERTGGATMSNLAPIASHRTPSGTGVRASRCKSGELLERPDDCPKRCEMRPRRTPERGAKGDDGVLAGEATAAMAYAPNGGK
jgi:hypothetical protein